MSYGVGKRPGDAGNRKIDTGSAQSAVGKTTRIDQHGPEAAGSRGATAAPGFGAATATPGSRTATAAPGTGAATATPGSRTATAAPGAGAATAAGTGDASSLSAQVLAAARAGTLDAAAASQILHRPGVTAADQAQLARDSTAVAALRRAFPSQRADQVLAILAASSAAFRAALMPPGAFTAWVTEDRAQLWATMTAMSDWEGWVQTFRRLDAWRIVLELAGDAGKRAVLRPHVAAQWSWLMMSVPKPVGTRAQADAILQLYGDGAGISLGDKYLTWAALFRAPLARSGQDRSYPGGTMPGWNFETIYTAVSPDDDAMNLFFHQFRQMPRAHVDTASGVVMASLSRIKATSAANPADIWYANGAGGFVQTPVEFPVTTSFYMPDNWILMRSASAAGAPDVSRIEDHGQDSFGVNTPGVDPLSGGRVKPMTIFQNHATHEVGHAVGARALQRGRYHISGDDWALGYGSWAQDGSPEGYAQMCGWTAAMSATSYQVADTAGALHPLPGASIKSFLVGMVESGMASMAGHPVASAFGGAGAALEALAADSRLATSLLVQNVKAVAQYLPDMAYKIEHGIAPVAKVHFFCTRWGNRWVTYDAQCWHNKVSHYGLSSYKEMFAEMYTAKFTGAGLPPVHNAHDPGDFFHALQDAEPAELGLPAYSDPGAVSAGAAGPEAQPRGQTAGSERTRARSAQGLRSKPSGPVPPPPGKPL
jgi:hypothetical protein